MAKMVECHLPSRSRGIFNFMKPFQKNYTAIIAGVVIVAVILAWASSSFSSRPSTVSRRAALSPSLTVSQATLVISDGSSTFFSAAVPISQTSTAFSVLQSAMAGADIPLAYKFYPGMGYLVTKIGNVANDTSGAYWQYWMNDVYAREGASSVQVHAGDIVTWKFSASQQ
jgi:hypothetical protein